MLAAAFVVTGNAQQSGTPALSTAVLPVSVWSKSEGFEQNVGLEDIQVFDGKTSIDTLSVHKRNEPLAIGIMIDVSGSVKRSPAQLESIVSGLKMFLNSNRTGNEYFLIGFADGYKVLVENTTDSAAVAKALDGIAGREGKGNTRFYDAFGQALNKLANCRLQKVLIVVSDGQDTSSRESDFSDILQQAKKENALIYFVNTTAPGEYSSPLGLQGMELSQRLADITGGRYFQARASTNLGRVFLEIAAELANQYTVTIQLPRSPGSGKWRNVKLKLAKGSKLNRKEVTIRTRSGIYF
jgi:Ca-activated chloride channel family protein